MVKETLRFELELKECEIILVDDEGQEKTYMLKELTGKDRNKYLNKMTSRVKVGPNGKAMGIKSFDGMQSDLLKVSMFHESGEPVTVDEIESLPASTQQKLFDKAQELSGLDNAPDTEKND